MFCPQCLAENPNTSLRCIQCGRDFLGKEQASPPADETKKKAGIGVLPWIVGLAVGWYSGIFLLMFLAGTCAFLFLGKKLLDSNAQRYLVAIALQSGQTLILFILVLGLPLVKTIPIQWDIFFLVDVAVPVVGLAWLVLRPGLGPVIFLTIFQACALVINGLNFSEAMVGTLTHKALATHILWRCLALFMMWRSYVVAKNDSPAFQ